ncbi:hypothetical protein QYM36_018047 [Artemia franciscana]|uniref:Mutator-like transposase domain-containing protein n=1 Tax=Artemia franciscana TaxID=6661 RepID=A0AA88H7L1_ARTSF|nr:hypothetical protein QYM36_018047 [Artemia franciscana]
MEQDMMVEDFVLSILIHGLRYLEFIGDGDSSVHQRLIERVTYGKEIVKNECSNHVTKNFTGDLFSLTKNKYQFSKILTKSCISSLTKNLRGTIKKGQEDGGSVDNLKNLLRNVPSHVFGDHNKCSSGCSKSGNVEGKLSRVPTIVGEAVNDKLQEVIRKAPSLLIEVTTNIAETL